jgi:hypothetical protein
MTQNPYLPDNDQDVDNIKFYDKESDWKPPEEEEEDD